MWRSKCVGWRGWEWRRCACVAPAQSHPRAHVKGARRRTDMLVTLLVSHAPSSWLNSAARLNMLFMVVTLLVVHELMFWLKKVAP